MRQLLSACLLASMALCVCVAAAEPAAMDVPVWLFPIETPSARARAEGAAAIVVSIPGSDERLTLARINNAFNAPDWHPHEHGPMPEIVARGRAPQVIACAYCHLPLGQGRPENAALAGLSMDYLRAQLEDFRSGSRAQVGPAGYLPIHNMLVGARQLTDAEIDAAADYYSQQQLGQRVAVIEAERIPKVVARAWIHARDPLGGEETLGQRIIEVPPDFTRHEHRDDRMIYTAYVPPGSGERGRYLVESRADRRCAACHGASLEGSTQGPAIAGRSPTYLMRQLLAFNAQTRTGPRAEAMRHIAQALSMEDMIAVASYVASLPPTVL